MSSDSPILSPILRFSKRQVLSYQPVASVIGSLIATESERSESLEKFQTNKFPCSLSLNFSLRLFFGLAVFVFRTEFLRGEFEVIS